MCGRYTLTRLAEFTEMFPWVRSPSAQPPRQIQHCADAASGRGGE